MHRTKGDEDMRIVVAEDQHAERERLSAYIKRFGQEHGVPCDVELFEDGESLLEDYPRDCDILLLDIEMGMTNGVEAARRIRRFDDHVQILFITNLIQYALEGYGVDALNFLVKPVSYMTFSREMERAIRRLDYCSGASIRFMCDGALTMIHPRDITYVETQKHHVMLHTVSRVLPCGETMQSVESKLREYSFFRCHTSYLVNLAFVESVTGMDVTVAGDRLNISRMRKKDFLDALSRHMGDHR